ncbi:MAG TPA: hypothetical protein VLA00_17805 [Xanthobacteraceae bacterium]|nr:hypothetical protein [Xanthobacteraceae bacterium]
MFDTRSTDDGTFAQQCFEATWRAALDRDPAIERDASLREDTRARLARAVIEGVSQNGADVEAVVAFALRAIPSFRAGA